MKILVTGGAGFIGSQFVRASLLGELISSPDVQITVLDKLTYAGNISNLDSVAHHPGLTFVRGDITDVHLVDALVPGHDVLVNFAAETHVDRSLLGAYEFVATNVLGTQTLLDSCRKHGVGRFVQVSTDEVYGSIEQGSWAENQPLAPNSPYAASKAGSDMLALAQARSHGMDVVVTRCSNNYGPYQFPEKLIPLFITRLMEGRTVQLYGEGNNVRDWLHVSDHCVGIDLVLHHGCAGEVYHIGGGTEMTNIELTGRMLDAYGVGWDRVEYVSDRAGHDMRYSLDYARICDELGYMPSIPFEKGLVDTLDWYQENRDWWSPLRGSGDFSQ
ncbi:dTDP-glucose 4,6-dehydratase [Streptomyces sp. NPDC002602]|uniref:dTDP-glucose 4,6-dehydratase n=1 Tax=Streptomyces sp. NPDC002602 TaxID=3364654 RepID=UPI0036CCC5B2